MSQNPREPSEPAGDNPAGHTRGQTHSFQPEFHSNPILTSDPGRPPIPSLSNVTSSAEQFSATVSTLDNIRASDSIASITNPFARSGLVHRSPLPTTLVPDPAFTQSRTSLRPRSDNSRVAGAPQERNVLNNNRLRC